MEFEVGAKVGAYEIIDVISSSKTEIAYRVRNTQEHRIEVMRVLPLAMAGDQDATERFVREMRVHAKLSHPNILVFFAATQLERRLVMTTEFVEGVTLAEKLKSGPLPWTEAVALANQALSALEHAHARGVVHRDVTPNNIIITPEGAVKLADFGLAKATGSPQLTQAGTILGTLHYMSPEQVRGTAVDARSDLYSLALVLYEAVAGKVPFDYRSQFDVMAAQVNEIPRPPSTLNHSVPAELDAIILKAAAKAPADRFQSAEEFHAALEKLGKATQEPVSVPSGVVAHPEAPESAPARPAPAPEGLPAFAAEAATVMTAAVSAMALADVPATVPAAAVCLSMPLEPVAELAAQAATPEPAAVAVAVVAPAAGAAAASPDAHAAEAAPPAVPDIPVPSLEPAPATAFAMACVAGPAPDATPPAAVPDTLVAPAVPSIAAASDAVPAAVAAIPGAAAPAAAVVESPALPEAVAAATSASVPDGIPAVAVAASPAPVAPPAAAAESVSLEVASDAGGAMAAAVDGTAHAEPAPAPAAAASPAVSEPAPAAVPSDAAATPGLPAAVTVPAAAMGGANGTQAAVAAAPDAAAALSPPPQAYAPEPPAVVALVPAAFSPVALLAAVEPPLAAGAADGAPCVPAPAPLPYAEVPAMEEPPAAALPELSEAAEISPVLPVHPAAAPQPPVELSGAAAAAAPEKSSTGLPAPELVQIESGDKQDEPSGFFADPRSPAWDGGRVLFYAATMSLIAVVIVLALTR